ncbi:Ppx/GppA phosphatase family protein [Azotosporobacter soli]|uniref:Ppx/GppA phosphatase family protein n=1 Tax=Azotosporobacter soli TaxID=3055040 RepID=UPI0031FF00CC
MSERVAVIDLGSNSARLIIMQIYKNGAYNLIYHQKEAVRLSEGIAQDNKLQSAAMERALRSLQTFSHMCRLFNVDKTLAVGTAAVRNTKNGGAFVERVRKETGIPLRAVSGETEAKLGYLGAINTLDVENALLFDLGGGSTELTLIRNRKAEHMISLPFGAVNMTERFRLNNRASEGQLDELQAFFRKQLNQLPWLKNLNVPLLGVGGTARTIAKMDQRRKNYPFPKLHNYRMGSMSFRALWQDVSKLSFAQRRKVPGLGGERADIILAGIGIVKALQEKAHAQQLIVSGCGVREGLFLQYLLSRSGQSEVVANPLEHSTKNTLLLYNGNISHAEHVTKLADQLFCGCRDFFALDDRSRLMLRTAALLHDTGISINYYDHYRHSTYLVENARLFGLSHREQMLAAVITGWHHGPAFRFDHNRLYHQFLDEADWQTARKLALLLSIAESLDTTQMTLVKNVNAQIEAGRLSLQLDASAPTPLEQDAALRFSKWLRRDFQLELALK